MHHMHCTGSSSSTPGVQAGSSAAGAHHLPPDGFTLWDGAAAPSVHARSSGLADGTPHDARGILRWATAPPAGSNLPDLIAALIHTGAIPTATLYTWHKLR